MAGEDRAAARALELREELQKKPYKFDYFQALRRLECAHPDKPRIGSSSRPVDDPIRLGQEGSLAFAPASIASFEPGKEGRPYRLAVYFFGLLGPNGPLPLHLTEYARDRRRNHLDSTIVRFLDVFHHRMLTLFYRAWASAQPTVCFDRPESDRFGLYVGSLFGIGMPSLRERDAWPDLAKLHYAGQLLNATRNPEGLRSILRGYFRQPVEIEQFVGQWLELPPGTHCRLGASPGISALGETLILGARTWECQHKFRIIFGPLRFSDYDSLLPGRESHRRLIALLRNYVGHELAWDVTLVLKKEEVPPLVLDGSRQLGWTTWLNGGRMERAPDDLTLDPETVAA